MNYYLISSLSETLPDGIVTFLLGMAIVFSVLGLIILDIKVMTAVLRTKKLRKDAKIEEPKPTPAIESGDVSKETENEEELIAVIAAAVACMAQAEGTRLRIRSFRRINDVASGWSRSGRQDALNRF